MKIRLRSLYLIQHRFLFQDHRSSNIIKNVLFSLMLLFSGIFLFYKCRYGFGNIDESFYLVTPFRLIQGDALFTEEWNLSQMSSILLTPFVSLYLRLMGSTEGIILGMRYVYTFVHLLLAVFLYLRLRRYHWLGAALTAISFVLYVPFGIMALSYNSMCIMALVVSFVMLLTAQHHVCIQCVLSGMAFSAAVLCCPHLVIIYIIYMSLFIACYRRNIDSDWPWHISRFFYFTVGVIISAALFTVFVFSRASVRDILAAFPYILNDPEHPHISVLEKIKSYFHGILSISSLAKPIMLVLLCLFSFCKLDKHRKDHPLFYLIPAIICVILLLCHIRYTNPYINYMMWPINFLTPFIFLLSTNKAMPRLFFGVYLPGMMYSFVIHLASNQGIFAIASGSSVATVASILMICMFCHEMLSARTAIFSRIIILAMLCSMIFFQFSYQISLRYYSVFWENGMWDQTRLIDKGVYRGLLVSQQKEDLCNLVEKQMKDIQRFASDESKILYLTQATWYYLYNDYEMASYSGWLSGVNEFAIDRLEKYYEINPDKYPDIVFVDLYNPILAELFSERFEYSIHETENNILLFKKGYDSSGIEVPFPEEI